MRGPSVPLTLRTGSRPLQAAFLVPRLLYLLDVMSADAYGLKLPASRHAVEAALKAGPLSTCAAWT